MAKEYFATSIDRLFGKRPICRKTLFRNRNFWKKFGLRFDKRRHRTSRGETRARNETVLQIRLKYRLIWCVLDIGQHRSMTRNTTKLALGIVITAIGILFALIISVGQLLTTVPIRSTSSNLPILEPPNPDPYSIAIGLGFGAMLVIVGVFLIWKSRLEILYWKKPSEARNRVNMSWNLSEHEKQNTSLKGWCLFYSFDRTRKKKRDLQLLGATSNWNRNRATNSGLDWASNTYCYQLSSIRLPAAPKCANLSLLRIKLHRIF